jgi:ABC-type Fe3+ transport system permease subunit/DNA-binding beta-propeller fold protein YncE
MNWTLFKNSVLVSGLTMLLSMAFGLMAALWLSGLEMRWRTRWLGVAIGTLALPPFLVSNCWLYYLGYSGAWHRWLPLNIYTLGGTVWILALVSWPITLLAVLGAWQALETPQLESDMAVTCWTLIRGLLLPLARGALTQAGVLTFVLALNNFAVPAILQVKVYPAEVWVRFNTTFDSLSAFLTSWPMVVTPLLLLIWFRHHQVAWPRLEGPVPARIFRQQLGRGWFWGSGVGTILISALALGLPLAQLLSTKRTWSEFPAAVAAGQAACWNSFYFAVAAATVCILLGLLGWRWPVGLALWLPFLVPGVLMGIALIVVFNHPIFTAFYQGAGIVILALGIRYLAFGWNGIAHSMRATDPELADAAKLSGASRWQLFRHVQWPQISPQVAVIWYIIFLLCLWDVESVVLIVPPAGETLALRIFNLLHYGHNTQVNALCLALLLLALAPLLLWQAGKWILNARRGAVAALGICAALLLAGCSQNSAQEKALESKFFSDARIIGTRGAGVGQFNKPRSVAVDQQDNLYVVDITGRVQKFSPDGRYLLDWQMPQTDLGKPKGMGCDPDGNIIVVEPHYQRVNHFTPMGKLVAQWGQRGTNAGQFIMPRSVAVNSHGDYLLTEYTEVDRVQIFSGREKKLLLAFGHEGEGNGEFSRPEGICVDSADRIYVADSCNHRIQIFSPDGKWLRTYGKAGTGPGELSYPYDIRVDKAGRQYVCEFGNSRIQIFDANDKPLEIIGGAGGEPGQFSNPWSIAFDSKGNLYVADSQNHRVQKLVRRKDAAEQPGNQEVVKAELDGSRLFAGVVIVGEASR